MNDPVFYIAEAPTFSAGEILLALLILAAALALFAFVIVVGLKGFHRLGRGQRNSLPAKVAPLIVVFDVLILISSYDDSLFYAIAPLAAHTMAFVLGLTTKPIDPPPPMDLPPPSQSF